MNTVSPPGPEAGPGPGPEVEAGTPAGAASSRDRLLDVAGAMLRERGYHGSGLQEMVARSGSPRGSVYHYFPGGKEQLCAEALRRSAAAWGAAIEAGSRARDWPVGPLLAFLDDVADRLVASDFASGCPVATVALEVPHTPPAVQREARSAYVTWSEAIRRGFLARGLHEERAGELAWAVLAQIEGALVLAKATRDVAPLRAAGRHLLATLRAATPGGG